MSWICFCRAMNEAEIYEKMESLDPLKPVDHKTLSTHCGGDKGCYNCGGCQPHFEEIASDHNERVFELKKALEPSRGKVRISEKM